MTLAKILIAAAAVAASTSAVACDCAVAHHRTAVQHHARQGHAERRTRIVIVRESGAGYAGHDDERSSGARYINRVVHDDFGQGGYDRRDDRQDGYDRDERSGYHQEGYDQDGGRFASRGGSSYQASARYREETYQAGGYRAEGYQASGGHYGYLSDAEAGAYRSPYPVRERHGFAAGYSRTEESGGSWSWSSVDQHSGWGVPACRHLNDRLPYGHPRVPLCPGEGEVALGGGFFQDGGGVGGFPESYGGGGGGGYAIVGGGAGARAFASASASASVSVRFRGGFHGGHHGGGHKGGCGCGK